MRQLISIVLFIRSLEIGGAERQLVLLAQGLHQKGINVKVLTFYPGGALRDELSATGIAIMDLGKRGRWDVLPFFIRLVRCLRRFRPNVLYSFLPVANILSVLVRPFLHGKTMCVWGVRASNMDLSHYDRLSRFVSIIERMLSICADKIICNSEAGRAYHAAKGWAVGALSVIANGVDTQCFRFDPEGRRRLRIAWMAEQDEYLIGIVGRLDPMKGYETFLAAAAQLALQRSNVRFVCVGSGPYAYREQLINLACKFNISEKIIWAHSRNDMPAVYSAFDIATSCSSYGEGSSNAIAEAMSCERPCVVTNVGDSAGMVDEAGIVVHPLDARKLAQGWQKLIDLPEDVRHKLGAAARRRIEKFYSAETMLKSTIKTIEG